MSLENIFKSLLRRPKRKAFDEQPPSAGGDALDVREDSAVAPNQIINRTVLRRPSNQTILTAVPNSIDTRLPAENSPAVVRPVRPRRASENTLEEINRIENEKTVNTDKGFKANAMDALKNAGRGFLKGYAQTGSIIGGLGGAGLGTAQQLIDPATDEKIKKQKDLSKLYGIQERQIKTESDQQKLDREQANIDNIYTDNQRDADRQNLNEKKFDLDIDKFHEKQDFDEWRQKSGNERLDSYSAYNKWRMANGDKQQKSREEYNAWRREVDKANINLRGRGLDIQEKRANDTSNYQNNRLQLTREQQSQKVKEYMQRNNLTLAKFKAELDAKVADGKISQEQANAALADAQQ